MTQIREQIRLAWHRGPHMRAGFVVMREDVLMHKVIDTVNFARLNVILNGLHANT